VLTDNFIKTYSCDTQLDAHWEDNPQTHLSFKESIHADNENMGRKEEYGKKLGRRNSYEERES
jgi:hypothetical protein